MINKLEPVKAELRKRLQSAGVKRCLDYPEQIGNIGNFLPLAMLRSESCEIASTANLCMVYEYYITIYVCTQANIEKTKAHEDFIFACMNAIYASSTLNEDNRLGGVANMIVPTNIRFDEGIPFASDMLPQNAIQTSALSFKITLMDGRYD